MLRWHESSVVLLFSNITWEGCILHSPFTGAKLCLVSVRQLKLKGSLLTLDTVP